MGPEARFFDSLAFFTGLVQMDRHCKDEWIRMDKDGAQRGTERSAAEERGND
jgi:hypothetical protein